MTAAALNKFYASIVKGKNEEEIKNAYARYFDISYDTSDHHDLYTKRVLFEFKFGKNLTSIRTRSQILAQTMYYVRRLKFGDHPDKPIPAYLCLADQDYAILTETINWKTFYDDTKNKYDWDLAPSSPDKQLVQDIADSVTAKNIHVFNVSDETDFKVFSEKLSACLESQIGLELEDKKIISEDNFEEVFNYWNSIFGPSVLNGLKTSRYFVCDIQKGNTMPVKGESKVVFQFGSGEAKVKKILFKDYEYFWRLYAKVTDIDTIRAILAKIDRLTDEAMRRFHGEFFTPVKFAKKGLEYLEKTIGKKWWASGEYRLWDMAAGTGNLEYHLPQDALKYCYLSTLYIEDIEHLNKLFPDSAVFQYDYLNDDIEHFNNSIGLKFPWKMPQKLRTDLENPNIKWIILINPPFATSQIAGTNHGDSKQGVSETKIRGMMHADKLGEVSRELFSQFIYRIKMEFEGKQAHLGLFSKIKYLNSNNDQNFRNDVFHYVFERGFIFSSVNFSGTSRTSQFPVGFLIWKLNEKKKIEEQEIIVDIFNEKVEKVGFKIIASENKTTHLSKWIDRPPAKIKFPPFGSAVGIKGENKDRRDRISEGFLASLMCKGNDFQNQNNTAFLSGPYVSAGAFSVTPINFEKAMVVHAARRIPKATWINDRDQFMSPRKELSSEFITDCTIWSLFSNSNNTAALKSVQYEGEVYQIHNNFFPYLLNEVKTWEITDSEIRLTMSNAKDTFVAQWLNGRDLSTESQKVITAGKELYRFYFANLNQIRTPKFKIETWDAGLWQIKQSLIDVEIGEQFLLNLKTANAEIKEKIYPQLIDYRIILG